MVEDGGLTTCLELGIMPEPWFKAESAGSSIRSGLLENSNFDRPLREGERRLGAFILPPFQRDEVWSTKQKMEFVESIWDGLPLGSYTINVEPGIGADDYSGWLLDGQQRWTAIIDYVDGVFPVKGLYFDKLPIYQQRGFKTKSFPRCEAKLETAGQCEAVYKKLAYGGTAHLPDHISQETWRELASIIREAVQHSGSSVSLEDAMTYLEGRMGLHDKEHDETLTTAIPFGH